MKHILLAGNTAWSMYNFRAGLIRELINAGYVVTVVAPADDNFEKRIEQLGAKFVDITIEAKGTNPIADLKLTMRFWTVFKELKPDFIFFYTIKPNIYGSFAARVRKIPHIAITTGLGYTFLSNNIVAKIARSLYLLAFKGTKEVWFLNKDDYESFLSFKLIPKNKGSILRGEGINLQRFNASSVQPEKVTFLLMARMLWDKGVGEFVEASRVLKRKYPTSKFNLLGFIGVDNPSAISERQMTNWMKEGIVEYLGSTNDVVPYLKAASCIVLPSYREGVPITLLEAAAMCKPLVTTDSVGCRDTIDDGVTGYLCSVKNVQSLVEAMEKIILMTPAQRQAMGEAGREKMKREFDEKLVVAHYLDVLSKYKI